MIHLRGTRRIFPLDPAGLIKTPGAMLDAMVLLQDRLASQEALVVAVAVRGTATPARPPGAQGRAQKGATS